MKISMLDKTRSKCYGGIALLLSLVVFLPSNVLAQDYPPLTLPPGELRDITGKVIQPADLSNAKVSGIYQKNPLLLPLQGLTPGCYRIGIIVDCGNDASDPFGRASQYAIALQHGDKINFSASPVEPPSDPAFHAVLKSNGTPPMRGLLISSQAFYLSPDDKVGVGFPGDGGGLGQGILLMPTTKSADAIGIALKIDAADNAFIPDNPPLIHVSLSNGLNTPWSGFVRFNLFDLLTEKTTPTFVPVQIPAQGELTYDYKPTLQAGVFRLDAMPADGKEDSDAGSSTARTFMAYSPAKMARDLPDDWPLATHHSNPSPILKAPMPGFKWYRYFCAWGDLEPSRGVYNWNALDPTLDDIQKVGGKLLLTFEGTPGWANSTHNKQLAPDNFDDYRTFLHALIDHYDDGKSPLGAIEVWNEPNANCRWNDTLDKLVEMHKITFEETRRTQGRIKTVGITISGGYHPDYVDQLTALGVFNYIDIAAEHFYEEIGTYNRLDLRNNFPIKVDLLRLPMLRTRIYRPIWDTESGMGWENSNGQPRPGARMLTQNEWIEQLKKRKDYNADEPWLMWAGASEPRMAEEVVTGMVSELANDVEMHFTFMPNWYSLDKTLNLPWVANGCLGEVLRQVDYHYVIPLGINAVGGADNIGALAYRIGKPGQKQVVVLWAEQVTIKHPFPGPYTPAIDPVPVQLFCAPKTEVTVQDMYLRTQTKVQSATYPGGDAVTINVGEQPVFIWDWKSRDQ